MIYDVFLVAIFILLIIINYNRGAARSLAGVVNMIVSFIAATALGKWLAALVYDSMVKPGITSAVTDSVSNVTSDASTSIVNSLPSWLTGILSISEADLAGLMSEPLENAGDTVVEAVNSAVRPIAVDILTLLLTVIVFLILYFVVVRLLLKPILKLFDLPVIRTVNKVVGAVVGIVDAFLLVSMLAYLLKLVLSNSDLHSSWLNESIIYNSFIFYHFYSGNIFTAISSLIGI